MSTNLVPRLPRMMDPIPEARAGQVYVVGIGYIPQHFAATYGALGHWIYQGDRVLVPHRRRQQEGHLIINATPNFRPDDDEHHQLRTGSDGDSSRPNPLIDAHVPSEHDPEHAFSWQYARIDARLQACRRQMGAADATVGLEPLPHQLLGTNLLRNVPTRFREVRTSIFRERAVEMYYTLPGDQHVRKAQVEPLSINPSPASRDTLRAQVGIGNVTPRMASSLLGTSSYYYYGSRYAGDRRS